MSSTSSQPLSGGARVRIALFVSLMLPSIAFGVGVLPALVLLWGFFMMRRNRDFAYVQTSITIFKWLLCLVVVGCIFAALFNLYEFSKIELNDSYWNRVRRDDSLEHGIQSLFAATIPISYFLALHYLYLLPLRSHREWVEQHGAFASKPRYPSGKEIDIVKGEKLKPHSVADELLKWAALRDNGHITEEEFNEARRKLMQKA